MGGRGESNGGVRGRITAIAVALVLLSCVAPGSRPPAWKNAGTRMVWPLPPDPPRIEYVGAIRSAKDLGRPAGFWRRVTTFLFGEEPTAMVRPMAIAKNRDGLLVVVDPGIPTVHLFDLEHRTYRRPDRAAEGRLHTPVGVAIDDAGRAYVTDSVRRRVFVLDPEGRLVGELGEGLLERPTGISLGPDQDRLYVVDTLACRIFEFDLRTDAIRSFGGRGVGPGEFNGPTHIAVAPDGTLAVSDSLNFRVQRLAPDGDPIGSFGRAGNGGGDFSRPKGIAVDSVGRLYVVDTAFENVQIFAPDGTLLLAFAGPGTGPGELYLPTGVFLDSEGIIWLADSFNGRVSIFRFVGTGGA